MKSLWVLLEGSYGSYNIYYVGLEDELSMPVSHFPHTVNSWQVEFLPKLCL